MSNELTVLDHIRSLRRTVFSIFAIILAGSGIVHTFNEPILKFLLSPIALTTTTEPELQFLSPLDPLYFILKVDFTLGFLLTLPITLYILWRFIAPAEDTRGVLTPLSIIIASSLLSILVATYAYKLLIPLILKYMSGLVVPGTALSFTANGYLDFFLFTTALLILIFQIPLIIVGLAYARIIEPNDISRNRPYIYLCVVVLTAFITPTTDIISLALIAIPALVVVEFGTILARIVYARKYHSKTSTSTLIISGILLSLAIGALAALILTGESITLFSSTRSI